MRKISWIIVAIVSLVICGGVMAVTIPTWTITNSAAVHTPSADIRAYWDEACTQPLEEIKWGHIDEGKGIENSKTFWVKNSGDDMVCAEWHDDIEEVRPLRYDDSDMEYYNETLGYWRWWSEEWKWPTPPPPTLPASGMNVTPKVKGKVVPFASAPYLEPGEKVKVRYTIEFEISPIQTPPLPAEECVWNLTLGY